MLIGEESVQGLQVIPQKFSQIADSDRVQVTWGEVALLIGEKNLCFLGLEDVREGWNKLDPNFFCLAQILLGSRQSKNDYPFHAGKFEDFLLEKIG